MTNENTIAEVWLSAACACCAAFVVNAAEPWEDPEVNAINRLPARAISIPCETENLALDICQGRAEKAASRWVIPLNGEWDFKWKSATSVDHWEKETKIRVPGCWQLELAEAALILRSTPTCRIQSRRTRRG